MNILLFGGSFNPPHLGHRIVIEQAFELIPDIDELWLLPCYDHTFGKTLAPAKDRLEMCKLLLKDAGVERLLKICSIEIDHQTNGSTYQTLQLLKNDYPGHHFSFLIGSDQLPVFTKWQHYQELLEEMPFYVYPRAGFPLVPLYPHMTALTNKNQIITNISSTLARERLEQNQSLMGIIPAKILSYIKSHHLYGQSPTDQT